MGALMSLQLCQFGVDLTQSANSNSKALTWTRATGHYKGDRCRGPSSKKQSGKKREQKDSKNQSTGATALLLTLFDPTSELPSMIAIPAICLALSTVAAGCLRLWRYFGKADMVEAE